MEVDSNKRSPINWIDTIFNIVSTRTKILPQSLECYKMLPNFWSEFWNPTDSYTSALSSILISYSIGLSPFRLDGAKGERRLVKTLFGYINPFLQIGFFAVCFVFVILRNESILHYFFKNHVSVIADLTLKAVWCLGMPFIFYSAFSRCDEFVKLMRSFHVIDSIFKDQGVIFDYKNAMRKAYTGSIIATSSNCIFVGYSLWILLKNGIYPSFPAFVVYFQPNGYIFHIVIMFYGMCLRLSKRIDYNHKVSVIFFMHDE